MSAEMSDWYGKNPDPDVQEKLKFNLAHRPDHKVLRFCVDASFVSEVIQCLSIFPAIEKGVRLKLKGNDADLLQALSNHYTACGVVII